MHTLVVAALAIVAALPTTAAAQDAKYPVKTVRVVVPWPPGGSNDIVGRIVAQKLGERFGQQFIVDNRGGASGAIGSEYVARSEGDGYTLMVHSATHMANAHMYAKLPYDTLRDFVGVAPLARQVGIMVTHPSLPVRSVKELVALARARPDQIIYATSGTGGFLHMAMALFTSMTGTKLVHVPYKGGAPAAISTVAGETQMQIATVGSVITHIGAKRLNALAVSSDNRITQLPAVPTMVEAGVPGYEFTAWIAIFAPARTPRAIVERLNAEAGRLLGDPDVAANLTAQTLDPMRMTPEQFEARLKSDYEKYGKLVRLTGAKGE
jgi:tripartite-type tricarboxylate transporter receptor subunit TctC